MELNRRENDVRETELQQNVDKEAQNKLDHREHKDALENKSRIETSDVSSTKLDNSDIKQDYLDQRNAEAKKYIEDNFGDLYKQLSEYMSKHEYGPGDFNKYSQDPEFQTIHQQYLSLIDQDPMKYNLDNFEKKILDAKPNFYDTGSFSEQGINEFGYLGTCGPTTIANTLNKLLHVNEYTENKILSAAIESELCLTESLRPEECGGTTTDQFMTIYDKIIAIDDIPIKVELYEYNNALSIDEMAKELDQGKILNIAVDSATLWDKFAGNEDTATDHWITATKAIRSTDGELRGFSLIDSGGGVQYANVQYLERMCFGESDRKMTDPTCIVVSKKDNANE